MQKPTMVLLFSLIIYSVTLAAAAGHGIIWPATFFPDLMALDWRSQFNADLLLHLILLGARAAVPGAIRRASAVSCGAACSAFLTSSTSDGKQAADSTGRYWACITADKESAGGPARDLATSCD